MIKFLISTLQNNTSVVEFDVGVHMFLDMEGVQQLSSNFLVNTDRLK